MPERFLPEPLVQAIGRVAVNGARLDADVVVTMGSMVGYTGATSGARSRGIVAQPNDFSRSVDLIRELVRSHVKGPLAADVLDYLAKSKSVYRRRSVVIHGIWSVEPVKSDRHSCMGMRDPGKTALMSIAEVNGLADEIHQVRSMLVPIQPRLVAVLPHMSENVEARNPTQMFVLRETNHGGPGIA